MTTDTRLIQTLHTVTPSETHFVVGCDGYRGILSFWLVALVKRDGDSEPWICEFPIVCDGIETIDEQVCHHDRSSLHWSEMRKFGEGLKWHLDSDMKPVIQLLAKLWGDA